MLLSINNTGNEPVLKIVSYLDMTTKIDLLSKLLSEKTTDKNHDLINILCMNIKIHGEQAVFYSQTLMKLETCNDNNLHGIEVVLHMGKDYFMRDAIENMPDYLVELHQSDAVTPLMSSIKFFRHSVQKIFGNCVKRSNKQYVMRDTIFSDILKIASLNEAYMEDLSDSMATSDGAWRGRPELVSLVHDLERDIEEKLDKKSFYQETFTFEFYSTLLNLDLVEKFVTTIISGLNRYIGTRINMHNYKYRELIRSLLKYTVKVKRIKSGDIDGKNYKDTKNWLDDSCRL